MILTLGRGTGRRKQGFYETNLSAKQHSQKADARISCPHGNTGRAQGAQTAPRQGAEKADGERAAETGAHLTKGDGAEGQRDFSEIGPPEKTTGILKTITRRKEAARGELRRNQSAERARRKQIGHYGQRQGRQLGCSQSDQAAGSGIFPPSPRRFAARLRYPHYCPNQRR